MNDLRIYNRILTEAEIQALASMPPANLAPAVDSGTNQTVYLPGTIHLNGAVSDDGNPNPPGTIETTWSKISGFGEVSFYNSNSPATTAVFSTPSLKAQMSSPVEPVM